MGQLIDRDQSLFIRPPDAFLSMSPVEQQAQVLVGELQRDPRGTVQLIEQLPLQAATDFVSHVSGEGRAAWERLPLDVRVDTMHSLQGNTSLSPRSPPRAIEPDVPMAIDGLQQHAGQALDDARAWVRNHAGITTQAERDAGTAAGHPITRAVGKAGEIVLDVAGHVGALGAEAVRATPFYTHLGEFNQERSALARNRLLELGRSLAPNFGEGAVGPVDTRPWDAQANAVLRESTPGRIVSGIAHTGNDEGAPEAVVMAGAHAALAW
jgi:hypothetical protein